MLTAELSMTMVRAYEQIVTRDMMVRTEWWPMARYHRGKRVPGMLVYRRQPSPRLQRTTMKIHLIQLLSRT